MQFVTVESNMIHAVGYDPEQHVLEVVCKPSHLPVRRRAAGGVRGLAEGGVEGPLLSGQHPGRVPLPAGRAFAAPLNHKRVARVCRGLHQWVLPFGTPTEVRQETRQLFDDFMPGGGFVFATARDPGPRATG